VDVWETMTPAVADANNGMTSRGVGARCSRANMHHTMVHEHVSPSPFPPVLPSPLPRPLAVVLAACSIPQRPFPCFPTPAPHSPPSPLSQPSAAHTSPVTRHPSPRAVDGAQQQAAVCDCSSSIASAGRPGPNRDD
jgi:hypothetical protein